MRLAPDLSPDPNRFAANAVVAIMKPILAEVRKNNTTEA